MRSIEWIHALGQDVRYALRGLKSRPGFTAAVVATLALGIGANAAIFSIVDRLLFRPPPLLSAPQRTHRLYFASTFRGKERASSYTPYARYVDVTRDTRSFSRIAMITTRKLAIGTGTDAREMQIGIVTAPFWGFFDAPPALGRYFGASEDAPPQGANVAVLSYGMWQVEYGGRRDVLGKQIRIGPAPFTVIGVAPDGFVGMWPDQPPVAYVPAATYAPTTGVRVGKETWWGTYHWTWSEVIAQRKPTVSLATATADLTQAYRKSYDAERVSSPRQQPPSIARPHAIVGSVLSERGPNQSSVAKVATLVAGMAVLVLLIAFANVANLLLSRALRRRREIAVRLALGVSRGRLLAQLLTESLILALVGGLAGLAVAQWGAGLLRAAFAPDSVRQSVAFDPRTMLFAAAAVIAGGVLTGLAPVWQARRVELTNDLKAGAREGTFHRSRLRVALLVIQGALSVVLLVGAGLFVRSLENVKSMRLGYDAAPVLNVSLRTRGDKLDSVRSVALRRDLLAAAQAAPEVAHASFSITIPFWSTWSMSLYVAGIDSVSKLGQFNLNAVSPDYFATMGTRLIRGRGIESGDVEHTPTVMVVSENMAKTLWPGRDPLGQCVKVSSDTLPCTTVVGVAENIKANNLSNDPGLFYYLSSAQFHPDQTDLFVRTRAEDASRDAEAIRRRLQKLVPGDGYLSVTPLTTILGQQMQSWRLGATMFVAFGVLALALASIGLYSVIAYNVTQRTHEMGVRIALGAQIGDVIRLVVGQGLQLAVVGIALGAAGAAYAAKWVQPLLFSESARDPLVFGAVAMVLLLVSTAASFIPARRAARVDPNVALRGD